MGAQLNGILLWVVLGNGGCPAVVGLGNSGCPVDWYSNIIIGDFHSMKSNVLTSPWVH